MPNAVYHVIALLVAALAAVWGFRRGLARQTPAVIGVAFGLVCARLLGPGLVDVLYGAFPSVHGKVEQKFVYDTLSNAMVFFGIYAIFRTVTGFLGKVMASDDRTILDNIAGSLFGMFKYLLFLSIIFNFMAATNPRGELMRNVKADDGNVVEEVMLLGPALMGGEDALDLRHKLQLEEAKKIS